MSGNNEGDINDDGIVNVSDLNDLKINSLFNKERINE